MSADFYEIRFCPSCGLRYPLTAGHPFGTRCPSCLGETEVVLKRAVPSSPPTEEKLQTRARISLFALLDNLRSAWNVGSIFRTADGLGIPKLYLCGITPTPETANIRKTSLGAEKTVVWEHSLNALETAQNLKKAGHTLIALEQDAQAKSLTTIKKAVPPEKVILIVGNEITGVDPGILDSCDQIVHIPMRGQKRSFNVEVAFAIAAYTLCS